ncbi:MAG: type I-E CRISPR-associated protein Cse2/CasB [Panacagrimonas sp.]
MNTQPRSPFRSEDAFARSLRAYHAALHDRNRPASRAARARLRRCADPLDAFAERDAYDLLNATSEARRTNGFKVAADEEILALAPLLAWVKEHDGSQSLPTQLGQPKEAGQDRPRMSDLRFKRLLASSGTELFTELRRALQLIGKDEPANMLSLAEAVCDWDHEKYGPALRRRWAYDYYTGLSTKR